MIGGNQRLKQGFGLGIKNLKQKLQKDRVRFGEDKILIGPRLRPNRDSMEKKKN